MMAATQVFGKRAGKYAAECALTRKNKVYGSDEIVESVLEPIRSLQNRVCLSQNEQHVDLAKRHQDLAWTLWKYATVNRTESGLDEALKLLRGISAQIQAKDVKFANGSLESALELRNKVLFGEAILLASKSRKESRGSFYRSDYPTPDKAQARSKNVNLEQGEIVVK